MRRERAGFNDANLVAGADTFIQKNCAGCHTSSTPAARLDLTKLSYGPADPDNFMKLFTSNSGNNHGRWKNPRYDQLLELAARELDAKRRSRIYDDAQKLLTETDVAIVPLYWKAESTLLSPKFAGLEYNSMARMDLRNVKPVAK